MTQCDLVLSYMQSHGSINCWQASSELGVAALHSRISDLRRNGHVVEKVSERFINRYGDEQTGWKYVLIKEKK